MGSWSFAIGAMSGNWNFLSWLAYLDKKGILKHFKQIFKAFDDFQVLSICIVAFFI